MKSLKRLTVLTGTLVVAGTLLSPSAFAATGVTPYTGAATAGNGGDFGHGNCGYNNGGATKFAGPVGGKNSGLGGFEKGAVCIAPKVSYPPLPGIESLDPQPETQVPVTPPTEWDVEVTDGLFV